MRKVFLPRLPALDTKPAHPSLLVETSLLLPTAMATSLSSRNLIYGTSLPDVILGTAAHDAIYAGDGNDTAGGGLGNDTINFGRGDDVSAVDPVSGFFDDPGDDVYEGEDGNDIFEMGTGNDRAFGGSGNDLIGGGIGDDLLYGHEGDDFLTGGQSNFNPSFGAVGLSGSDTLDGGEGNDYLLGEAGNDLLIGNEVFFLDSKGDPIPFLSDTLYGGEGDDTLLSGAGQDDLIGGDGNDSLQLNTRFWLGYGLSLFGNDGTDELVITGNSYTPSRTMVDLRLSTIFTMETLRFQFESGPAVMPNTSVILTAAQFNSFATIRGTNVDTRSERVLIDFTGAANFNGSTPQFLGMSNPLDEVVIMGATASANQITGTRISDRVTGLGGNDRLTGLGGNDSLFGEDGNDSLYGGVGANLLEGGDADDLLLSSGPGSRLFGGAGNDTLDLSSFAEPGAVTVEGGAGDDSFRLIAGPAVSGSNGLVPTRVFAVAGGDGHDVVTFADPLAGAPPVGAGYDYNLRQSSFTGIEEIRIETPGTMYQLLFRMDAAVFGADAPDQITLVGDPTQGFLDLRIELGSQAVVNLSGTSFVNWGSSWLYIEDRAGTAPNTARTITGSSLSDRILTGLGNDVLRGAAGADTIYARDGADQLLGDDGADSLFGENGNDRLFGGNDGDWLYGGLGRDTLRGAAGNDQLVGGSDDDLLQGETGADQLRGGDQADTLIGGVGADTLWGEGGADAFVFLTRTDSRGTVRDTIMDFQSGTDSIDLRALGQTLAFIGSQAFSGAGNGEIRYTATGLVLIDLNGDRIADMQFQLTGTPTLLATDFLLAP